MMEEQSRSAQLATLGVVASGVAHEINNPIQGIMNYATLIHNAPEKTGRVVDFSQQIINESVRVANITTDLRHYSKDDVLTKVSSGVHDLLRGVISLVKATILNQGVVIETFFTESLPEIKVQPQGIQQVVVNLLDNAYYAIRVKEGPAEKKVITVKTELESIKTVLYVAIELSDKGVGMSPGVLARAKEAFFSTKPSSQGTGIGLSIVQELVARHDGQVDIESVEGEYTKIRILLPIPV